MGIGIFLAGLTSLALSDYGLVFALPYSLTGSTTGSSDDVMRSRIRVLLMTSGPERVDEMGRLLIQRRDRASFCHCSLRLAHLFDELLHLVT